MTNSSDCQSLMLNMKKTAYGFLMVLIICRTVFCRDCCSSSYMLENGTCSDGTDLNLECQYEKYVQRDFIYHNNTLILPNETDVNITIEPDSFCMGTFNDSKLVAVLCFEDEIPYLRTFSTFLLISDFFLVITLIIYFAFPSLRDLQGKSVMSFMGCLCIGYFLLAVIQEEYFFPSKTCTALGFILYYFFMCAFVWLTIISFNIWNLATWQVTCSDHLLFLVFSCLGYGVPAIFLIAAIIAHVIPGDHIKPDFSACWFTDKKTTLVYFYGPIGVLFLCNIIFFTLTVTRLWKDYKDSNPATRIKVLRFKCLLYLKLFLIMGITWIFEILSFFFEGDGWVVTDIVNSLQGLIIFIVMVATRKRVLRLILNNKIFGFGFNHWQMIQDEESENNADADQIQLS